MQQADAYKIALIDWLLAYGRSEGMGHTTRMALETLAQRGVDYTASETPQFQQTVTDTGDSDCHATFARAFSATIHPIGSTDHTDRYEFHIPEDDMQEMILGTVIRMVVTTAALGDTAWRQRLDNPLAKPVHPLPA